LPGFTKIIIVAFFWDNIDGAIAFKSYNLLANPAHNCKAASFGFLVTNVAITQP